VPSSATRYAQHRDATLAWTTFGEGPTDLLFLAGIVSHVEHVWDDPGMASFLRRLGSFARVVLMDRRGTGLSDPLDGSLTLDDEVGDITAVLDAAGSECAVLFGYLTGGPLAIKVAAERPGRVAALANPGEILASGTVYGTVVGAGVRFKDRGTHALRDVPGRWPLFGVL
jgi:pimeloyl-ACP methyl ester carboxylesterase